jgi:cyanophycinase-like exopeptidase
LYGCNPKEFSTQSDKGKVWIGVGLYESTAIIFRGDKFEVIGDGKVVITDGEENGGKKYYPLSVGERFDLKARPKL